MKEISENELEGQEMPGDGWFIIEAAGQHPARRGEVKFTQNLTPEVLAGIVEAGVPAEGLPIDRDHLSLDARNSTEALGWLRELAMCDGQLAGRIEWTPLGLPLIQGRVYKHFSTVYPLPGEQLAGGEYMPERLIGLALTNKPNNKEGQPPITNSRERVGEVRGTNDEVRMENSAPAAQEWEEDEAGYLWPKESFSPDEESGGLTKPTKKEAMEYSPELLAALGLAEGAGDEEVMGAVNALNKRVADAEAAGAAAAADAEADKLVNQEEKETGAVLNEEERKEVKEQLITNREHGLKYMKLLCNSRRPQQEAQVVTNRRYADHSEVKPLTNRAENSELCIANRAKEICAEARKAGKPIDYYTGLKRARSEAESAHKNN